MSGFVKCSEYCFICDLIPKLLNMKKTLVVTLVGLVMLFVATGANAQNKMGYISLQELVPHMPEYKKAEQDLVDYQKALAEQLQDYEANYRYKDSVYKADSSKWSAAVREVKRKELNELGIKIMTFQQEAQQQLQRKEQELILPVQQKAVETIRVVAKENGYTYVFSKESLFVSPPGDDLLQLVARKMGIKIETPTAALNPANK